jgi:hypothetical protein
MRIRFNASIASATWHYDAGEEANFPDEQALSFIAGGLAEVVDTAQPAQPAQPVAPIETATDSRDVAPSSMPSSMPSAMPLTMPSPPLTKKKGK